MLNSKTDYRSYFASVWDYVKMSYFLKQCHVNQPNFSRFMKGSEYDYLISWDKLENLYQEISKKIT